MDIIILAAIAFFILWRLYSVLGQDVGFKQSFQQKEAPVDNPIHDDFSSQLSQLRKLDPGFEEDEFLEGVRGAFTMTIEALNKGDRKTLENLMSPRVFKQFDQMIKTRDKKGQVLDNSLLRIKSAEISEMECKDGSMVFVTVKIISEQILVLKDKDGAILEGDPDQIEILTDVITFSRDVRSNDPNWMIVATTSGE